MEISVETSRTTVQSIISVSKTPKLTVVESPGNKTGRVKVCQVSRKYFPSYRWKHVTGKTRTKNPGNRI